MPTHIHVQAAQQSWMDIKSMSNPEFGEAEDWTESSSWFFQVRLRVFTIGLSVQCVCVCICVCMCMCVFVFVFVCVLGLRQCGEERRIAKAPRSVHSSTVQPVLQSKCERQVMPKINLLAILNAFYCEADIRVPTTNYC
jgi:hypothetical protein